MDASALLKSQGWRGTGHSLHATSDTIGLAKPLLLNRKNNTKGLGDKQHFTSDQWWMNAFDEQLKGIETTKKDGKIGVKQTITTGKLNAIEKGSLGKWSLWTSFVRGGLLEGTLDGIKKDTSDDSTSEDDDDDADQGMKGLAAGSLMGGGFMQTQETKEEKRARKEAKAARKADRAARRAAKAERRAARAIRAKGVELTESATTSGSEDKAEKKARRAKKEEKRRKRAKE